MNTKEVMALVDAHAGFGHWESTHSVSALAQLLATLAERDAELTKAQDELNCTEVELEAAACNLPEDKFNQGFECMGDFARAVSEGYKAELATLRAAATKALEALIIQPTMRHSTHVLRTETMARNEAIAALQSALGGPTT